MIKKLIFFLSIILFLIPFAGKAEAAILRLNLYKENEKISWDNNSPEKIQYFKDLYFVEPTGGNDYKITISSFKGTALKEFGTNLLIGMWIDYVDPKTNKLKGGFQELTKGEIKIDLPYYYNASLAKISDESGKEIFSANLSSFAACNENNICEPKLKENNENCHSDCLKPSPSPNPIPTPSNFWLIIPLIITAVIVFTVLFVIFIIWKKNQGKI